MEILVRRADLTDMRDLWIWRNDVSTRMMSINTDEIAWPDHQAWFKNVMTNSGKCLYIGEKDGKKIGVCRFDIGEDGQSAEVSINLNPEMRGQGLSAVLLKSCINQFLREKSVGLTATIRKENIASIKCFTKCGFKQTRGDDKLCFFVMHDA